VDLSVGSRRNLAPSGYVIPAGRVTIATDLDQVLGVLNPDTRSRLAILLNEAGTAVVGRRQDFNALLGELPHDISGLTTLLGQLVSDNHTLASVLQNSSEFIAQGAKRRRDISRMIDVLGRTAGVIDTRQTALEQTLGRAPATLAALRVFLGKLDAATVPLGPAARELTAATPPLLLTLDRLALFRRSAEPTLRTAIEVAPELTHLATGVTPVLRQARPALAAVDSLSTRALPAIGRTIDGSVDNILAVVDNWSRAIQFRDGLSHVFRGEASFTPNTITALINNLLKANLTTPAKPHAGTHRATAAVTSTGVTEPASPAAGAPTRNPKDVGGLVAAILAPVTPPSVAPATHNLGSLLNYLLGR
jgi:phospholipid/cholesterol/gamma-HCH transport system substrate-binding protein